MKLRQKIKSTKYLIDAPLRLKRFFSRSFFSKSLHLPIWEKNWLASSFNKRKLLTFKNTLFLVTSLLIVCSLLFLMFGGNHPKEDSLQTSQEDENVLQNGQAVQKQDLGNFYLTIDKLNLAAPIIQGVDPTNQEKYNMALKDGVAHMIGTALPDAGKGNIFIYGHSSAAEKSKYSEIFTGLDNLKFGDQIKIHYKDIEYNYIVREKKFVEKSDLSVLNQTETAQLTLMTCWPIGTDDRRLIVVAKTN